MFVVDVTILNYLYWPQCCGEHQLVLLVTGLFRLLSTVDMRVVLVAFFAGRQLLFTGGCCCHCMSPVATGSYRWLLLLWLPLDVTVACRSPVAAVHGRQSLSLLCGWSFLVAVNVAGSFR